MSVTVTLKVHVCVLEDVSDTVQVTRVVPMANSVPLAWVHTSVPEAIPTLSDAMSGQVNRAVLRPVLVLDVRLRGHVIMGGVVSITVIAYEQEAELPAASHALQVILVLDPNAKILLAGPPVQLVLITPILSTISTCSVRDQLYSAVGPPSEAARSLVAGQVTRGGSLS